MLKHRLLMSALLIPATIGLFAWDHYLGDRAPVLFILMLLLSARCVWEFVTLVRAAGYRPQSALVLSGTWLMITAAWWPHLLSHQWPLRFFDEPLAYIAGALGVVVVVLLLNAVLRFPSLQRATETASAAPRPGHQVATLGIELFAVGYIGGLLALTCQLRWMGYRSDYEGYGYFPLSALVIVTKMGDVGAYTFGRLIGGPKMTPKLSPGKTISGGIGHLLTAGLSAVAWMVWLGPIIVLTLPSAGWRVGPAFVFGIAVGFAGLIGDLAESLIKRDVGVKDAPALLPGFGGLLDLMDSLLLAGPVAYAMWFFLR